MKSTDIRFSFTNLPIRLKEKFCPSFSYHSDSFIIELILHQLRLFSGVNNIKSVITKLLIRCVFTNKNQYQILQTPEFT